MLEGHYGVDAGPGGADPGGEWGESGTVFRDVILLALVGFIAIVLLLLPHVNPVGERKEQADDPPGNVIVELFWDEGRDVDLDLWVRAPGDIPVGYSSRGGTYFNLLRDDLGIYKDPTPINYEVAYSRGIAPGEHIANVHLYRFDVASRGPVEARMVVTVVDPETGSRSQIIDAPFTLDRVGEERTIVRFTLDNRGTLEPGSLNARPAVLRGSSAK